MVTNVPAPPEGFSEFGNWFNEVFRLWAAKWPIWVLQGLIFFTIVALPYFVVYISFFGWMISRSARGGESPPDPMLFGMITLLYLMLFVGFVLAQFLYPGMVKTALKQMRGEQISVGDLFSGARYAWGCFVVCLATVLGFLLCCVGLFATQALFFLALPVMIDTPVGTSRSISLSWEVSMKNFWFFVVFVFVIAILSRAGLFACYVGVIATISFFAIAQAVAYMRIFYGNGGTAGQPIMPSSAPIPPPYVPGNGPGNYPSA